MAEWYEEAAPTATCPRCFARVQLQPGTFSIQRGGCKHVVRIERFYGSYWVVFEEGPCSSRKSTASKTAIREPQ